MNGINPKIMEVLSKNVKPLNLQTVDLCGMIHPSPKFLNVKTEIANIGKTFKQPSVDEFVK